jgi:hypothetical protein
LPKLDGEDDDPPPRGGVPMRLRRPWAAVLRRATVMFAQAVLTIVLLGNAAAAWTVPLVALMVPRKRGEPERSAL